MAILVRRAVASRQAQHAGPELIQDRAATATQAHVQGRSTAEVVRRARGAQTVDLRNRPREDIHPLDVRNPGGPVRRGVNSFASACQ